MTRRTDAKPRVHGSTPFVKCLTIAAFAIWFAAGGCSTTKTLTPDPPPEPEKAVVPEYAYLPHPVGFALGDVQQIFSEPNAPKIETLEKCTADFEQLLARTKSISEREKGVREFVTKNATQYHWCYYSKVISLTKSLDNEEFVDEKQKKILTAFEFLVPVARAFMAEYHDSRYIRWAIREYRVLSDVYFFRRVEISPQMSGELVELSDPSQGFPGMREEVPASVLEKYKVGAVAKPTREAEERVPRIESNTGPGSDPQLVDDNDPASDWPGRNPASEAKDQLPPPDMPTQN